MQTKICAMCKQELPVSAFAFKSIKKGTLQPYCRACQKIYRTNHYQENKTHIISQIRKRQADIAKFIWEYKEQHPCIKCGMSHPAVLEFHHRIDTDKEICISKVSDNGWSMTRILDEIAKCDVLCANCHRLLHFEMRV